MSSTCLSIQIAEQLCLISQRIVLPRLVDIAGVDCHLGSIECHFEVGSGASSYHQILSESQGRIQSRIVYGRKMVEKKMDPLSSALPYWLSLREITSYDFFSGRVTFATLLSNTILHECAHLLQSTRGGRHYKSVHNRHFYRALRDLHFSCSDLVLKEVEEALAILDVGWDESDLPFSTEPIEWAAGDLGYFHDDKEGESAFIVIAPYRRMLCVLCYSGVSEGFHMKVPREKARLLTGEIPRPDDVHYRRIVDRPKINDEIAALYEGEIFRGRVVGRQGLFYSIRLYLSAGDGIYVESKDPVSVPIAFAWRKSADLDSG